MGIRKFGITEMTWEEERLGITERETYVSIDENRVV